MLDLDLACALDPVVFAESKLHLGYTLDPSQQQVLRSAARYLALNTYRQWGKSTITAILALHTAIYLARALVLLLAPTERQSSELYRKVSDFALALGGELPRAVEMSKSFLTLENGSRIVSLPGSAETIRGYSAPTLTVVDEAARAEDDLFTALTPMLSSGGGRLILLSTPSGRRGFFYRVWSTPGPWERVLVPAAGGRLPEKELRWQQAHMTVLEYRQEYGCEFLAPAGAALAPDVIASMFSREVPVMFAGYTAERPRVAVLSNEIEVMKW